MTFNPQIPQPKDILSDSQLDLLTNFTQLNAVYGTTGDHVPFNASSGLGKHNKVTFLSQGNDPDTDAPTTRENEIAIFALEDGPDTELYTRKESNGDVNQMTKDGEVYIGVHPVFAINISDLTPNSNTGAGTFNFTVNSSFNFDSANSNRITASRCTYRFAFTNQVVDDSGNPTNKYFWTANGFLNSSNPLLGKVINDSTYGNRVDPSFIEIEFVNQNNTVVTSLTGASIVCWRFQ